MEIPAHRKRRFGLALLVPALAALPLFPASDATAQPRTIVLPSGQKSIRMVRADTPPVLDGVLDDPVWSRAAVVDDLHQVTPIEYAEPSERTEVLLLYDDDMLYVGVRLYDSEPGRITANRLRQGATIINDDAIFVTLDPFLSRSAGYFFGVNPNGVRMEGLYRNVSEFYADWDAIWYVQTGRFEGGWTAELAIPFKSLSLDPGTDTWGLNFSRSIARRNEDIAWSTRNQRWDPSSSGIAIGFEGINQGRGLDIVPSLSVSGSRTSATSARDSDLRPSLDVSYKITPQLNALLTVNTDFSATEVDDRQVNLTRFNLFFPEKRDFFLREADIFEFGRIGASDGNGSVSGAERQNGRPFFSRRIGLSPTGEIVDLDYGGKVSGRVGRFEIGALSIRQDEFGAVDASTLSVLRARASLVGESAIGMIYTHGDPRSSTENSLAGIDYLYRNSNLPGGRTIEAYGWMQESSTEGLDGRNRALGAGVSIPSNTGFRGGFAMREFQENFLPALGFVSRQGVRDHAGHFGWRRRPPEGYWQSIHAGIDWQRIESIGGGLESQQIGVTPLEMVNRSGDMLYVRSNIRKEVLPAPFEISPGVVIPEGRYAFADLGVEWRAASHRRFSGRLAYIASEFYDGRNSRVFGAATWQPSPNFRANLGFNFNDVRLPWGDFRTRVLSLGLDTVFSATLSWVNLLQYDNVTDVLGLNSRLHWIPEAGREVYFVINHNLERMNGGSSFNSLSTEAVAKVSYTFRF
jgi:hypothetical protein